MKTLRYISMLAAAGMLLTFTACESDGDNDFEDNEKPGVFEAIDNLCEGELAPVKDYDKAAKFRVDGNVLGIRTFEFLPGDRYLITFDYYGYYAPSAKVKAPMFAKTKSDSESRYKYGTYSENPDGSFYIDNIGTFKMEALNEDGYIVTVDLDENYGYQYPIELYAWRERYETEAYKLTERFCHTWDVVRVQIGYYDVKTNKLVKVKDITDPRELADDYVRSIIATPCGSFIKLDWDGSVEEISNWNWSNTNRQVFSIYDPDGYYDYDTMQVIFRNEYAMFTKYSEYDRYEDYYEDYYDEYLRSDDDDDDDYHIIETVTCRAAN